MNLQREKAEVFRSLHHRKKILILPNAWDVPSARIFEDEGFPAVATSSAGLMVSLGYPDGQSIPKNEFFGAVGRITKSLHVPLSADMVAGFGESVGSIRSSVRRVIKEGAVGINIEDASHETKKLYPVEKQVEKLKSIKKLWEELKVPFVINARTDALIYAKGDEKAKFDEVLRRARAYRDAGADCVYPMRLTEANLISIFVKSLDCPINVMIRKGLPTIKELENLGVARVSFGPAASYATMGLLKRASREVIEEGTFKSLTEGAITFDELNRLASPSATT